MKETLEHRGLGCLGALLTAPLTALLTWQIIGADVFAGLAGLTGFFLAMGGYRLLGRQSSDFGVMISALVALIAALPGAYLGYAAVIRQDNEAFGCTFEEALTLVPTVCADPGNLVQVLWDLGGILLLTLLSSFLFARYLRLRQPEAGPR